MAARGMLADVRPLRESRAFRAWWLGSSVSVLGSQLTSFAVAYDVWSVAHQPALVGGVALAALVPTVAGALLGGRLADRRDRRSLVLGTRTGQLVVTVALASLALIGAASVSVLYVAVALQAFFAALGAPANRSFPARLLPPDRLGAGLALGRLADQVSLLAGPFLAGLLTSAVGVQACFVVDAGTFVVALLGVAALPAMRPEALLGAPDLRGVRAALGLLARTPVLLGAFATDLAATLLAMPVALFPVVNAERYGGSAVTLGLLAPALGLGGIAAGALSGRFTASGQQGRVMLVSAATWAAAIAGFGLAPELGVALACLVLAGAADTVSVISRTSLVQQATPDAVRGRVNALDYLVGVCGPQLGNFRAGLVAAATSGAASAVLGGFTALAAVAVVAAATPALRRVRVSAARGSC
jgi:MFS family permease